MNHLHRFRQQLAVIIFFGGVIPAGLSVIVFVALDRFVDIPILWVVGATTAAFIILSYLMGTILTRYAVAPLEMIWQAIWHVSPDTPDTPSPIIDSVKVGREMVSAMVRQTYELASHGEKVRSLSNTPAQSQSRSHELLEHIPQPLLVLDKDQAVSSINHAASEFLSLPAEKIIGKNIYDVLRMSFQTVDTFDSWLAETSTSRASATASWEHVRAQLDDSKTLRQFDLAVSYSKDNSFGYETILTIFDKTPTYQLEDEASSYVALAVHELRTPLTVLRGYIEVFDDELGSQLTPELREFMRKMHAAAESLTAFVSNILNVARVDENQLVLSLHEANWNAVLPEIVKDLELRASVRGKTIEIDIEENLPAVAIDKISMYEVVSNLVDNAIKYGSTSPKIVVHARLSKDGTVETIVQDFGLGIPGSAIGGLFTKFYRSHSSKNAVSGSGLGLYLVKAIVMAHGGNVWVNSKEGEGSSFGFSLQSYEAASKNESKTKSSDGIERQANGWIKNHSLYRR